MLYHARAMPDLRPRRRAQRSPQRLPVEKNCADDDGRRPRRRRDGALAAPPPTTGGGAMERMRARARRRPRPRPRARLPHHPLSSRRPRPRRPSRAATTSRSRRRRRRRRRPRARRRRAGGAAAPPAARAARRRLIKSRRARRKRGPVSEDDEEEPLSAEASAARRRAATEEARLGAGLTGRVAPVQTRPAAQREAEAKLYRRARTSFWPGPCLSVSGPVRLFSRPLADQLEGLHVEPGPPASFHSLALIDARLGAPFLPASKAPRTRQGTIERPADPIARIRSRPAHLQRPPDGRVGTHRPTLSMHRVDGASRPRGSQQVHPPPPSLPFFSAPPLSPPALLPPQALQLSLGTLQLHDHPLFLQEHTLQRRLRRLAEQVTPPPAAAAASPPAPAPLPHSPLTPPPRPLSPRPQLAEVQHKEVVGLLAHKIGELSRQLESEEKAAANRDGGGFDSGPEAAAEAASRTARTRALCISLLQARRQKDEQEFSERLLGRRMLQIWGKIKAQRQLQGFRATRAKLQLQVTGSATTAAATTTTAAAAATTSISHLPPHPLSVLSQPYRDCLAELDGQQGVGEGTPVGGPRRLQRRR